MTAVVRKQYKAELENGQGTREGEARVKANGRCKSVCACVKTGANQSVRYGFRV